MTDYQKLSTIIFRIFASLFVFTGVIAFVISLTLIFLAFVVPGSFGMGMLVGLFYALPFTLFGLLLYKSSRRLAAWVCMNLE
jgi:hypothetical protein